MYYAHTPVNGNGACIVLKLRLVNWEKLEIITSMEPSESRGLVSQQHADDVSNAESSLQHVNTVT